jgi:hypothetical protein
MSGGHFDYQQYKIGQIADQVEQLIRSNKDEELNDWGEPKGYHYSEKTIDAFRRGLRYLEIAQIYAQRIDWLVSGDDGEETFHRRLIEDINELNERNENGDAE